MTRAAVLLAMAIVLTACLGPPDNPARRAEAMAVADAFLHAVSGGQADRGWSLLHPYSQEDWGDQAAWVEAAGKADWSRFAFTVLRTRYCDGVMCPVDLDVPGAAASVPDFIRARDAGVVILDPPPDDENTAEIWVWLPDLFRGRGGIMVPPP